MSNTNAHGPKRAILSARVSTEEQAKTGYSIPEQLRELRSYAAREGALGEVQERARCKKEAGRVRLPPERRRQRPRGVRAGDGGGAEDLPLRSRGRVGAVCAPLSGT